MLIKELPPHEISNFPDVSQALKNPNGLLAFGGNLSVLQLIKAYEHGIFPWFNEDQPILWWSPDPRAVIFFSHIKISRSLKKNLRHKKFFVTIDTEFQTVMKCCAHPRSKQNATWITEEMQHAYYELHKAGRAHSVEVWENNKLIGGLYGVDCGHVFTGESMFNFQPDAAKIALIYLADHLKKFNYYFIDCQINNPFLMKLGAEEIPRALFIQQLEQGLQIPNSDAWLNIANPLERILI